MSTMYTTKRDLVAQIAMLPGVIKIVELTSADQEVHLRITIKTQEEKAADLGVSVADHFEIKDVFGSKA